MKLLRVYALCILYTVTSCVEEINIPLTSSDESILVVEATLTDQHENQEVILSRSYPLGSEQTPTVSGAQVRIESSNGETYTFDEVSPGRYVSVSPFSAQANISYQLHVNTGNDSYMSSSELLPNQVPIANVYAETIVNDLNEEGVRIVVNSEDDNSGITYLRYQYEETYKIIAPRYSPKELIVLENNFPYPPDFLLQFVNENGFDDEALRDYFFELNLRDEQKQICYNTVISNQIFQTSSSDLITNEIDYELRFLAKSDPVLRHRYSILVRQLVQSPSAFEFYELLNSFSSNDDLFSQLQVGFIEGNIQNTTNEDQRVVGFFEVVSVDEKRIFFNYDDLYPNDNIPPYFVSCDFTLSPEILEEDFAHNITNSPIIDALGSGFIFLDETEFPSSGPFSYNPYQMVLSECGDCTNYGATTIPDFWEE